MYNIHTIVEKINPIKVVLHHEDPEIEHFLTDSRSLLRPEHTLFFAFRTSTGDGHRYIKELYDHGVRNFVVSGDAHLLPSVIEGSNILYVNDPLKVLQKLASAWREEFTIPVVGITGSNGKTITKEFLYQLLSPCFQIVRSPRSYNSQLGVPLSVLKMTPKDDLAIFEAGISQPAEMERLEKLILPSYGIFTNIGSAHQENFTDLEEKIDEKLFLFKHSQVIVYCAEDEEIYKGICRAGLEDKAVSWTRNSKDDNGSFLVVQSIEKRNKDNDTTKLSFVCGGKEYHVVIPFIDDASISDILHCITLVAKVFPDQLEIALSHLPQLQAIRMRLEMKEGVKDNIVINDTYNNDISSLAIAIDFLKLRAEQSRLRKVVILSDIFQSSLTPRSLYRRISEMVKRIDCDLFIGIGRDLSRHKDFFNELKSFFFPFTEAFLKSQLIDTLSHSAILVKGARQYRFEVIADHLAEQGHVTTLEVNLQSYIANLHSYRGLLPQHTKVMAMIKANAYGLGAYETALAMQEARVDYLAVAVADEGKELRQKGIYLPIVVMDPGMKEIDTLLDYHLEPVVHSMKQFERLYDHVDREGFIGIPIHIEFDTGMHRLGFATSEAQALGERIASQRILEVQSIFTHLAVADDPSQDDFTRKQISSYKEAYETVASTIGYRPLRHILNTAGCERFTEDSLDMIRLGIGLYGVSPTKRLFLEPVVQLHTTLMQISSVAPHETIGYGRRGIMPQGGKVGIIPIGYADGYNRRFGNGVGKVIIRGKVYPTIGNICMDLTMIDLSSAKDGEVLEGDEVTLIGKELPVDLSEMGAAIGTIPYEVVANLSSRIKRVYYKE